MSEERLLHDLGKLAREEQEAANARLDERWDRLSAGTLTPEEETELLAFSATSPESRETYEAFRPLGAEFQARVVQSIRDLPTAAEPEVVKPPPGELLFWPRLAPRIAGWGLASAAAAATLVMFLRPSAPLPGYTLAGISGGTSEKRGEETEATDFAPGKSFQVVLSPDTEVTQTMFLKAQAFLRRGQELRRVDVESSVDANGVATLEGSLDRSLTPGTWTLWAVVGRWGKLPDPEELQSFSAGAPVHRRDWTAVPQNIRIRAP
ncbi:MAG TPA: hypothetical protein VE078_09530 [Thermoanaerobaculia bacterium]|nr:hypothetical protein [Thermoanaerobaculia bacterium]